MFFKRVLQVMAFSTLMAFPWSLFSCDDGSFWQSPQEIIEENYGSVSGSRGFYNLVSSGSTDVAFPCCPLSECWFICESELYKSYNELMSLYGERKDLEVVVVPAYNTVFRGGWEYPKVYVHHGSIKGFVPGNFNSFVRSGDFCVGRGAYAVFFDVCFPEGGRSYGGASGASYCRGVASRLEWCSGDVPFDKDFYIHTTIGGLPGYIVNRTPFYHYLPDGTVAGSCPCICDVGVLPSEDWCNRACRSLVGMTKDLNDKYEIY